MPHIHRAYPEKWFIPFKPIAQAALAADESIAMAMMFTTQHPDGKDLAHAIFTVIRKGNKVIGRNIISHINPDGQSYCKGHADDCAEYDAVDESKLIDELRETVFGFGARMLADKNSPITMDPSKPIYYIQTPVGATKEEVVERMDEDNNPEGEIPKQVLQRVLGLTPDSSPTRTTKGAESLDDYLKRTVPGAQKIQLTPKENESTAPLNNLANAAKEMELIKKYGKKKIQDLAKKINYNGAIINKNKKHVTKSTS
jgi:hypothetical protein